MKKIFSSTLAIILFTAIFISSCEKDKDPGAPKLPPASSLILNTENFNNPSDTLKKSASETTIAHYYNWGHSIGVVAFWNTYMTLNLAIPVFAYEEILKHKAEYLGDNKWEWSVDFNHFNQIFTARLIAFRISNEDYRAEMYIGVNGLEFKWFEGTVNNDRTHASWTMFESPQNNSKLFEIEWNRDWGKNSENIMYTFVKTDDPEKGSYILYSYDPILNFNSSYEVKLSNNTTTLEWSTKTLAGHVKDFGRFKDNLWHCWNESLMDVVCP